jgi:hypothetical protein
VGGIERFAHRIRAPEAGGEANQAMRVHARRRPADPVKPEHHPLGAPDLGNRAIEPTCSLLAAEFPDHVVRTRHSRARHVRVEQEWPPDQLEQQVRSPAQGPHQAARAQKAPRADQIVNDLDRKTGSRGREDVHDAADSIVTGSSSGCGQRESSVSRRVPLVVTAAFIIVE